MNMLQKRSIKELQNIYKLVDRICAKYKECDRHNVSQTLRAFKQTPIKRLEMSIRRANLSLYSKRD